MRPCQGRVTGSNPVTRSKMSTRGCDQEINRDLEEIDGRSLDRLLREFQLRDICTKFLLNVPGIPLGQVRKILTSYMVIAEDEGISLRPGMISLRYLWINFDIKRAWIGDSKRESQGEENRPDYLVTNPDHDNYWQAKKVRIEKFGGNILLEKTKHDISTSKIAEVIIREFS